MNNQHNPCSCPRCGYDLTGFAAQWNHDGEVLANAACPLRGTCAECGLHFEWAALLSAKVVAPRWFVEARDRRLRDYNWVRTALRAMLPWKFWRHIALETPHRIAPRVRFVIGALLAVPVGVFLTLVYKYAFNLLYSYFSNPNSLPRLKAFVMNGSLARGLFYEYSSAFAAEFRGGLRPLFAVCVAGLVAYPLMLACLPWSRRIAKVRAAHITRAASYALTPLIVVIIIHLPAQLSSYYIEGFWPNSGWSYAVRYYCDPLAGSPSLFGVHNARSFGWPLMMLWFLVWWACALRIGFRMQDWQRVFIAIAVPSVLAQVVFTLLCIPTG